MAPQQGYGTTANRNRSSASHMDTKQDLTPEEDHSRIESARSISGAECREKRSAATRRRDLSLDIPFYRTFPIAAAFIRSSRTKYSSSDGWLSERMQAQKRNTKALVQ